MTTLTIQDFEQDQQEVIEKTDIQQLSGYCLELQGLEDNIQSKEEEIKKLKEQADKIHQRSYLICSRSRDYHL